MNKKAWLVTLIAVLGGISIAIAQNKVAPIVLILQEEFAISSSVVGWLSSIFCAVGIVVAVPAAVLVNKIGARRTILWSIFFTLVGTVIGAVSNSVAMLMISRFIEGIGCGLVVIAIPSVITMWFPPEKRGLPMGVWSSWQMFAQALCFFFAVGISTAFNWQGVWWVSGAVLLVLLILCFIFVKTPPADQNFAEIETEEQVPMTGLLKFKSLWWISLAMFCFNFACFGFVTWVATCWHTSFDMDLEMANRYITYMYIWELPIVIAVGYILDRIKDRKRFCVITFAGYVIAAAIPFVLPSASFIIPFIIIYPIFEGAVISALWTAVPQTVPDSRYTALAIAVFGMLQNVGMLVGPPVTGAAIDALGWYGAAIPIAIVAIIGTGATAVTKLYAPNETAEANKAST